MPSPSKPDHALIYATLGFALIAVIGILGADLVNEGDGTATVGQIVAVLAPIGASLVFLLKGGEAIQTLRNVDEKTHKIERAVNGELDARIEAAVERVLERWTAPTRKGE